MYKRYTLVLLALLCSGIIYAQGEINHIRQNIKHLSSPALHGRGYVSKGGEKAAAHIRNCFKEYGVLPFDTDSTYYQLHSFPINTFPGNISLSINKKELDPGSDYIVYGGSSPYSTGDKAQKLTRINLDNVKDSAACDKVKAKFKPGKAYFLRGADTLMKYRKLSIRSFAKEFPKNLFIVSKPGKLTWTANQDTVPSTIVYVEDSVLPKKPKKASVVVETKYITSFASQNVIGYVPGTEQPDSFIVFSAHYDHLGHMGRRTYFPGAHDNASGTSLVLYLADYFAHHPQKYSVAFMLFSGEEAGLIGSEYYNEHPIFPLSKIRFVVNLDMTGDATDGITVVNALAQQAAFKVLDTINKQKNYLPKLNQREQTKNSDHYSFSKKDVPAVFIFTNSSKGKPYYHDVFDVAKAMSLNNVDKLAKLLIDFTGAY
jgi:Predicted aminopeptidases